MLTSLLRLIRRFPRASLVCGLAVAAALVINAGQGPPPWSVQQVRRALGVAAASTSKPAAAGAAVSETSGLRVLHRHIALDDRTVAHPGAPAVTAATGILIDPDAGEILWAKDAHAARAPASTTKIVSSLVALENFAPDTVLTVTRSALVQAPDETMMGIEVGDRYTVAELLQGMLLVSANDAATTLATETVGMRRFVLAMNEQMAALGLHDSHFVTPVGLDDPQHYSSAYDLAVAGLAAYDGFDMFRSLVGTRDLDVPATGGHNAYRLHNISRILSAYPPATGIKSGYTGGAGYCLVAMAERDGHRMLAVLLDDGHMVSDARALMEWGFMQEGLGPLPTPTPVPTLRPHR